MTKIYFTCELELQNLYAISKSIEDTIQFDIVNRENRNIIKKLKLLNYDIQREVWDIERIFRDTTPVPPEPIPVESGNC